MKKIIGLLTIVCLFSFNVYSAEYIASQYTDGMAQASDVQNHGETKGDQDEYQVGGFGNGYGMVNYYVSDPVNAEGSAVAEVISNGYSFFYDNMDGAESHSSNVVKSWVETKGTWSKADFQSGAEQSNWVSMPGDLKFGYGYNQSSIQNEGSIENNGPISAQNTSTAAGYTTVTFGLTENTANTKVNSFTEAHNSSPSIVGNFKAEGGFGGGNTLIKGNASVQGQFSGNFKVDSQDYNTTHGSGTVNLTNGFQDGVGNVVRSEVNSFSRIGKDTQ